MSDRVAQRLTGPLSSADEVQSLLLPILAVLELAPGLASGSGSGSSLSSSSSPSPSPAQLLKRRLSLIQSAVITHVYLTWSPLLPPNLLRALFVPPPSSPYAGRVAALSYTTLVGLLTRSKRPPGAGTGTGTGTGTGGSPLVHVATLELVVDLLADLVRGFGVAELYPAVFGTGTGTGPVEDEVWSGLLRDVVAVPAKVANAAGGLLPSPSPSRCRCEVRDELEWTNYFVRYAESFVSLLNSPSPSPRPRPSALSLALSLLLQHAPSLLSSSSPPPSLLSLLLPSLLPLPFPADPSALMRRSTTASTLRAVLADLAPRDSAKLIRHILDAVDKYAADGDRTSTNSRGASWVLLELVGHLELRDDHEDGTARVALEMVHDPNEQWRTGTARAVVDWAARSDNQGESAVLERLLERAAKVWSDERAINQSTVQSRLFISTLVLYTIRALPTQSSAVLSLSRSPSFLGAVSSSLSHLRPLPRLLGMLLAEFVSARTLAPGSPLRPLDFGDVWTGDSPELALVRALRAELDHDHNDEPDGDDWVDALRSHWSPGPTPSPAPPRQASAPTSHAPTPAPPPPPPPAPRRPLISIIGSDSDSDSDDLAPFALPDAPPASYLATLASADASEYATALPSTQSSATRRRGKLRAPVYVPELVAYLRGRDPDGKDEQSDEQAERVECALREGEQLVRRKHGWGTELDEHAVDLAVALVGLQDQFESPGFDLSKRQILAALVAACPTKVAPCVIEQYFFPHYSVSQRHAMLTALALGARELAGFDPPPPTPPPTRTLASAPPAPAAELFPSKRLPPALHRRLVAPPPPAPAPAAPSPLDALAASLTASALTSTASSAESSIPLAARSKLLSVRRFASAAAPTPTAAAFTDLSAEYFLGPLVNRFWAHLVSTKGRGGPLTEPLTLSRYLSTLALLLHASRHSPHFLAVLAPQALELVLALRSADEDRTVESAEMEVLVVVFDALVALDGGYSIMRTVEGGSALVGDCREWAAELFEREDSGAGSDGVGRTGRAAAGTLLRLDEVQRRWTSTVGW